MTGLLKKTPALWILVSALLLATGLIWQSARWAYQIELDNLQGTGEERLTLYASTLH